MFEIALFINIKWKWHHITYNGWFAIKPNPNDVPEGSTIQKVALQPLTLHLINVQIRQARDAGYCRRGKEELLWSNYFEAEKVILVGLNVNNYFDTKFNSFFKFSCLKIYISINFWNSFHKNLLNNVKKSQMYFILRFSKLCLCHLNN